MALDEPNENDDVYEEGGYSFCIEKALANQVSYLKLDISYMGFTIDSDLVIQGGGGCGSSCSTGSCGG